MCGHILDEPRVHLSAQEVQLFPQARDRRVRHVAPTHTSATSMSGIGGAQLRAGRFALLLLDALERARVSAHLVLQLLQRLVADIDRAAVHLKLVH